MKKLFSLFCFLFCTIVLSFSSFATNSPRPNRVTTQEEEIRANKDIEEQKNKNIKKDITFEGAADASLDLAKDNVDKLPEAYRGIADGFLTGVGAIGSTTFLIISCIIGLTELIGLWIAFDKANEDVLKTFLFSICCFPYFFWIKAKLAGFSFGKFLVIMILNPFLLFMPGLWLNYKLASNFTNIHGFKTIVCTFLPGFIGLWGGTYKGTKGQF